MRTSILLFLMLSFMGFARAQKAQTLFEHANEKYNLGQFEESIQLYDSLLKGHLESHDLYFNLGNAYFKLNDYTSAIYYFEKAKKLDPGNEDCSYNLELVNSKIADNIEALPEIALKKWWQNLLFFFNEKEWMLVNVITFSFFLASLALFFLIQSATFRQWFMGVVVTLMVISILSGFVGYRSFKNKNTHDTAIIFTPTVNIKSAPDEKSNTIFILHKGSKVKLLEQNSNWQKVKISDGNVGWIQIEDYKVI